MFGPILFRIYKKNSDIESSPYVICQGHSRPLCKILHATLFLLPLGIYALFYTHLLDKGCEMILNLISKSGKAKAKSFKMLFAVSFVKMVIKTILSSTYFRIDSDQCKH